MTSLPDHVVFIKVSKEGGGVDLGKEIKILLLSSLSKQLQQNTMYCHGE